MYGVLFFAENMSFEFPVNNLSRLDSPFALPIAALQKDYSWARHLAQRNRT